MSAGEEPMPIVQIDHLTDLATRALCNAGLPHNDATIIVTHLLDCELSGNPSHGFYRLPGVVKWANGDQGRKSFSITKASESASIIDCGNTHGLLAAQRTVDLALETLNTESVAIVGAHNYSGTTGSIGAYAQQFADKGFIGIVMCNSEYAVAPTGGKQAILGTNPIAIGIPSNDKPVIIDFATAAQTYGDLMLAAREGRTVPYGIVLDREGNPSNDPSDADSGVQLPMAGHKGYGLALAIELLAGPFVGAKAGRNAVPGSDGLLMLALSPSLFVPREHFLGDVGALVKEIKQSPRAPGVDEIRIPGERTQQQRRSSQEAGAVELSPTVWTELQQLAEAGN